MPPELLQTSEVKEEWEDTITGAVEPLAAKYGLDHDAWYHDAPIWYLGEIQLNLIRDKGLSLLEIHQGDSNHLTLQIQKLGKEMLQSVLECLIVTTE